MKKVLVIGAVAIALVALAAGAMLWVGAEASPLRPLVGRMPLGQESSLCDPSIPPCGWPPGGDSRP